MCERLQSLDENDVCAHSVAAVNNRNKQGEDWLPCPAAPLYIELGSHNRTKANPWVL